MTGVVTEVIDPVPLFRRIAAEHDRCFWLDGGAPSPGAGRRSILGGLDADDVSLTYVAARREVTRHDGSGSRVVGEDIFEVLEREMAGDGAEVLWVGYFGYACRSDLPAATGASGGMPDAVWMRTRDVVVIEHGPDAVGGPGLAPGQVGRDHVPTHPPEQTGATGLVVPSGYVAAFEAVQDALHAGDSYEVNLTYRERVASDLDPVEAYLRLRDLNPAPYAGFLQHRGAWLLSSSPEGYPSIDRDRTVETKPITGTTPRGATSEADERLRAHLAQGAKFRAENLMIVDLVRNELSMVCVPGTVEVPVLMDVESYPSLHQLVSTVRGRLREEVSTVAALRALFPAGSMTGAPKLRTMELIRGLESTPRGVYSGAFGWLSGDGRADLGVVIRSLTTTGDGAWEVGTGGGITVQSTVREEYAETRWKLDRMLRVFASQGSPDQPEAGQPGKRHSGLTQVAHEHR